MALNLNQTQGQSFGAAGPNHAPGLVPDPGATTNNPPNLLGDDAAFHTQASLLPNILPTPTRAGDIIYWNGSTWVTLAGNNSGTQFLQETSAGVPSWATIAAATGTLVSIVTYLSSQTITIPATATKAFIRMWGGTGGSGGIGNNAAPSGSGGTGAGGYLEKYLTGLTPGNTIVFTRGPAGSAGASTPTAGGNGGASTLVGGTQPITTLTANGSNGSAVATNSSAGTAGGTATNGDYNAPAVPGQNGIDAGATGTGGFAGVNMFSVGANGVGGSTNTAGTAGNPGGLIIMWFS